MMGGINLKYSYVTDYKNNDRLRHSFNELIEKTFDFNFVEWFDNGFWSEKYIPCSLVDRYKIIANVSVNLMDFNRDGTEKHYMQIGTVMTDEEYRGQGLSRYLMERVIAEYEGKVDGIYLFGGDNVVHFYSKFGFIRGTEYQYSKVVKVANQKMQVEHVNMADKTRRQNFIDAIKNSVSNERFSKDNFGLNAFWATGPLRDLVYYHTDEDAYVIADRKKDDLLIHQMISTHKVDLEKITSSFGSSIKKVTLGFTPNEANGYEVREFHKEDCTFFYLGKDLENIGEKKLIFPTLSHA